MRAKSTKPKSHAGVLKASERHAAGFFEFGGQRLPFKGTSGPPKEAPRKAEGKPVRHDVLIAQRTIPTEPAPGATGSTPGLTGRGQLIGGPVRRA